MATRYFSEPRPDIQALISASGKRVLDVGCGAGTLAGALKQAGATLVAGIELDPQAAACARAVVDVLVEGSAVSCELPFAEREFDYIVFADVLEHVPDPDHVVARLLPYLADHGRVVISVPNWRFYLVMLRLLVDRWAYTEHGVRDRTHLRVFTRHSLLAMVSRNGLHAERLSRNFRLFEDQSRMGRAGALATRAANATLARFLFRDLMAYQYVVIAHRR
jgi:2-polyprenyl-3-methyl-5-hydroxy-6-metoxy-1,4-benzoquinol methylase